jgi:hypothetical protein
VLAETTVALDEDLELLQTVEVRANPRRETYTSELPPSGLEAIFMEPCSLDHGLKRR